MREKEGRNWKWEYMVDRTENGREFIYIEREGRKKGAGVRPHITRVDRRRWEERKRLAVRMRRRRPWGVVTA